MPYATYQDMLTRFGEAELIALSDRENLGVVVPALLDAALAEASAEIDAYLVSRYALPLAVIPPLFVTHACDIARYRLSGATVTEVDTARDRYKDAIRFLESVRDGKIGLGADVSAAPVNAAQDLCMLATDSPARIFSRGSR